MPRITLTCLVVALVASGAHVARADSAGVVVSGDPLLQGPVAARVEAWLKGHAYDIVTTPLDADAFTTVGNCLLLDDLDCARGVIESRATASSVAYITVHTTDTNMAVSAWWFVKGHDTTHDHGSCKGCAPDGWRPITDTLMVSITGANANLGHLDLRSHPGGVVAKIDGKRIGTTPVALDLSSGDHVIVLERDGRRLARRAVTISPGESQTIDMPVRPVAAKRPPREVSNAGPIVAIVAGVVAIGGGGYALYYGHKDDRAYDFPHSTAIGVGIAGAGLASLITGAVLFDRGAPTHGPVVSLTSRSAFVGWTARF